MLNQLSTPVNRSISSSFRIPTISPIKSLLKLDDISYSRLVRRTKANCGHCSRHYLKSRSQCWWTKTRWTLRTFKDTYELDFNLKDITKQPTLAITVDLTNYSNIYTKVWFIRKQKSCINEGCKVTYFSHHRTQSVRRWRFDFLVFFFFSGEKEK